MKGAHTLVRALADPALQQARARFVGVPPPRAVRATRDLASRLGVADRVELLGGLNGPAKWAQFEWADAFGYPTNDDGQPLVVLEAMAAALPIVASPVGGVEETVGRTAVLVAPGDDRALATALRSLIEQPERRFEFGGAARARFLDRYTPDAFQVRFAGLFTEMLRLEHDACAA